MRFTLRQIEYFIAAGEAGSIALASERINISPPAISAAISQLEAELDTQLFIRHHAQGVSLTPSGRVLMIEARRLLQQALSLYGVAIEAQDEVRGSLNVGCLVTLAPMILPELALSFTSAHREARIRPQMDHQEMLLAGLSRAALDVAVTYDLQLPPEMAFEPLVELPVHAVVAESHPLARRGSTTLTELAELPLILLDLPLSAEYFISLFMTEGLKPSIAFRIAHPDVIRTMVANGYGYTLANAAPRSVQALDGRRTVRIALAGRHRPMTVGLVTLRQMRRSRLLGAFLEHARALISSAHVPGMVAPGATGRDGRDAADGLGEAG